MLQLSEQQEQEIIKFYLEPHSMNDTVKTFNLPNRYQLIKLLKKFNIEQHSPAVKRQLQRTNAEKTCLECYGRTNVGQFGSKEFLTAMRVKYGGVGRGSKIVKQKIDSTIKDKYNVDNIAQLDSTQEKIKQTNLKKYGGTGFASTELNKKGKNTCKELYGDENYNNTELRAQTNLELYGTAHPPMGFYKVESETFDSFPELCFYLYYRMSSVDISRTIEPFTYEYENKTWQYFPDFKIGNIIYELKGDQFLAKDGTWQNPFNLQDKKIKAKYACAKANNVQILYSKDYQKYIDWFYKQGYKKESFIINQNIN